MLTRYFSQETESPSLCKWYWLDLSKLYGLMHFWMYSIILLLLRKMIMNSFIFVTANSCEFEDLLSNCDSLKKTAGCGHELLKEKCKATCLCENKIYWDAQCALHRTKWRELQHFIETYHRRNCRHVSYKYGSTQ